MGEFFSTDRSMFIRTINTKTTTHRLFERTVEHFYHIRTGTEKGYSLRLQVWAITIYLFNAGINRTSSMKLHHDSEITNNLSWHLTHRMRKAFETNTPDTLEQWR